MGRGLKLYTITIRCHIDGHQHSYVVWFSSKASIVRYFKGKKDRLVSVCEGSRLNPLDFTEMKPSVPHYEKNGRAEPEYEPGEDFW